MSLFKKRDERVDAVQFNPGNAFEIEKIRKHLRGYNYRVENDVMTLATGFGAVTVQAGQYIIKDDGGIYLMSAEDFEAKYEPES